MARKKSFNYDNPYGNAPETLDDSLFYGLTLDDEQVAFREAIWSKDKLVVFANAKAGSGKTTIAVGVADLLIKYGRYDGLVYIISPTMESRQGYMPGDLSDKSAYYMEPLYQALTTIGVSMGMALANDIMNAKHGTGYIHAMPHTFLRGVNFENKVVILDESQNYCLDELQKVLTRIHDSCKVIVIGHSGQCDMNNKSKSGFTKYLEHFKGDPRVAICNLTRNYRGWISTHADAIND